jgi:hypothetical protein
MTRGKMHSRFSPNNIKSCPLSFAQKCALVLCIGGWAKGKHFHVYQISSFYLGEYWENTKNK